MVISDGTGLSDWAAVEVVDTTMEPSPKVHELDGTAVSTPFTNDEDENEADGQIVMTSGDWVGSETVPLPPRPEPDTGKLFETGRLVVYVKMVEPCP
jgi:hypothetical protein